MVGTPLHHAISSASRTSVTPPTFQPWPTFGEEEIAAATRVLASGRVNQWTGDEVVQFERRYASNLGVAHAVALANGTAALELALWTLGVGPGDEVITTSRTFVATASAIVLRGATPIFADVERDSGNLSARTVEPHVTPRTKAIIAVHLAGWPVEMDDLLALAEQRGIDVIEDCAQAHGAHYRGKPVGTLGRLGAFSFCQDKIVTTGGEGGLLATDDETLWRRAWSLKDHGKSYEAAFERPHPPGFRWLHESFGTNWRMMEVQAAIGSVQLARLAEWSGQRRANAAVLDEGLACLPGVRVERPPEHVVHGEYKHYVYLRPEALRTGWTRDRIMDEVAAMGAPCYSGSCSEIYLEKAFVDAGLTPRERRPVAKELGETSLMFLVHPTLGQEQMAFTVDAVADVMQRATR